MYNFYVESKQKQKDKKGRGGERGEKGKEEGRAGEGITAAIEMNFSRISTLALLDCAVTICVATQKLIFNTKINKIKYRN